MMNTEKIYNMTNWKTYLDPTDNVRVQRFLKKRGMEVLTGMVTSINEAIDYKSEKMMVLVHPNVSSLVLITSEDYEEILEFCLNFFQEREEYEMCSETLSVLKRVRNKEEKKE